MKLNKLFLMGAMGLGLFACSDDLDENGQNGNAQKGEKTYVAISMDFGNSATGRAIGDGGATKPDNGTDDNGTTEESTAKRIRLIVTDATGNIEYNGQFDSDEVTAKTKIIELYAGEKKFYAFVNEPGTTVDGKTTYYFDDAKYAVDKTWANPTITQPASYFADATNGFMMSNDKEVVQTIVSGIDQTEVATSKENQVSIAVERVAAKVSVELKENAVDASTVYLISMQSKIGNADLVKTAAASETAAVYFGTYAMAQNDATETAYRGTPAFSEESYVTNWRWNATGAVTGDNLKVEDAVNADNEYYTKVSYYCLENVHKIGEYKEKNTTVVQVEAVMYPKEFQNFTLAHDATENKYSVTIAKGEEKTAQTVGTSFYLIRAVSDNDTEGKLVNNYVLKSNLLAQFEKLSEADKTGITEKDAKVTKVISVLNGLNYAFSEEYEDGKGYFNVWVNNLINATPTSYDASPVFRNDWYNLAIQKVTLPGSPNGDLEDDKPINPETAIQVKVTVKPWNLINHNVDLQ